MARCALYLRCGNEETSRSRKHVVKKSSFDLRLRAVFTALFKITGDRLLRFVPGSLFVRDTSPTVLLCAAALLVAFARFKPGRKLTEFAVLFAPAAFGVYLLHVSPLVFEHVIGNRFALSGGFRSRLSRSPCLPRQELSWLSDLRRTKCAYCFLRPWGFRSCAEKPKNPYAGCGCMLLMLLQKGNNQTAA